MLHFSTLRPRTAARTASPPHIATTLAGVPDGKVLMAPGTAISVVGGVQESAKRPQEEETQAEAMPHQEAPCMFGFRSGVALAGGIPATLLNTVVPLFALSRGDVVLPNVMLSDVMASHKFYEAVYTWGFSVTMVSICFVLRESTRYWRQALPSISQDVDMFLLILYVVCVPCLFGLVAFQYKHDMSFTSGSRDESVVDMIFNFDFAFWFLHVFFTSLFFMGCCGMAFLYNWRLTPALNSKGLVHPSDRFWRDLASILISLLTPVGMVVRVLHLFLATTVWGVLLVLVEVALIQLFLIGGLMGVSRLMLELDAKEPMLNLGQWRFRS